MFQSDRDGAFDLYLMNGDGSEVRRLMQPPSGLSPSQRPRKDMPAWSADYTMVAYVSSPGDQGGIYVVGADGHGSHLVLDRGQLKGLSALSWSPSGSEIAFEAYNFGEVPANQVNREIYVLDLQTGTYRNITNDPADDEHPSWSPDGSRLIFASSRQGGGVFVMAADGSGVTRLASGASPDWSPDGSRIVYGLDGEIFTMNADGSGQTQLTVSPGRDISPNWSPDGSMIVFDSERDGNEEIYVMNADGSNQTRLTNDPGYDVNPAW